MNQCKDCAKWVARGVHPLSTVEGGFCGRDDRQAAITWADNGACPAFEARRDWADSTAAKITERASFWTNERIAEEIRAAAKAHYEGGKP